jgi:hypothetical protein
MNKEMNEISKLLDRDMPLEEKYSRIYELAISIIPIRRYDEPEPSPESLDYCTRKEQQVASLIMNLSMFQTRQYRFPKLFKFEDWQDACEAGLHLIHKMVRGPKLEPRQMPEYEQFEELMRSKSHQIYLDYLAGKYPPEFFEHGG